MYQFVDVNSYEEVRSSPSDNMRFNGVYINELIDGYRQLYVAGRHLIGRNVDMTPVPLRDGRWLNAVSYNSRELTITYQLTADTSESLRDKIAILNALLSPQKVVPVIFDDEPEYTYYATYADSPNLDEQHLSFTSSFTLICPNPFKFKNKQTSTNGKIPALEYQNINPLKLVASVTSNAQEVEIINGTKLIFLKGNYAMNDLITITWGDEIKVFHNTRNALLDLQQFSFPEEFTIKSNDQVTGRNCTITLIEWSDQRL